MRNDISVRVVAKSTFTFNIVYLSLHLHRERLDVIIVYSSNKANLPLVFRELESVLRVTNGHSALKFGYFNTNLFDKDNGQVSGSAAFPMGTATRNTRRIKLHSGLYVDSTLKNGHQADRYFSTSHPRRLNVNINTAIGKGDFFTLNRRRFIFFFASIPRRCFSHGIRRFFDD